MYGERPICYTCSRFWRLSFDLRKCDAYPKGVPEDIIGASNDHKEKFDGDHGLQYEKGEPQDRE